MFSEKLLRYIEPATIFTVITGAIYLIGWFFSLSYYNRLNINSYFFEFTPLYHFKMAFLPVYTSGFILAISLFWKFNNTKLSAFRRNLIFFFGSILIIILGIRMDELIFIILGLSGSLIILYLSMRKCSMFDGSNKSNIIFLLIMIFIINMALSMFLGDLMAQNDIESENIIIFHWKGESPNEIDGKDLVLIAIRDENYYVMERQKPANKQPEVYLIPKDQIEFATLKNLNNS